jgi:hypothetical protein
MGAVDAQGRLCGVDSGVKDRKFGYYLPQASFVCIDKCPSTTDVTTFYCSGDAWKR